MATSILGADDAALGNLILGVVPIEELLIAGTSGVVALYKCDVAIAASSLPDVIGAFDASVNGAGNTATVYGIDDLSLTLPNATSAVSPPPFTKVTTSHSYYKYSGNDIPIGTTGSIMLWFKPSEFGDKKIVPNSGPTTPQSYYDIVRLSNDSTGLAVAIRATQTNPNGDYAFALNWNADPALTGDSHFSYFGLVSNTSFFSDKLVQTVPFIGPNIQYFLVLTWDSSGIYGYINGRLCFNGPAFQINPPTDLGNACNFKIGDCGGAYDLVTLLDRKMSSGEIATLYQAGLNTVSVALQATQLFTNYAATFNRNLRVTNERSEVLRTGLRNLRITKEFVEVLRSVSHDSHNVTQTLVLTQTATGYTTKGVIQTLVFTQTATAIKASHPIVQRLDFTETVSLAGSIHNVSVFDHLLMTQSESFPHQRTVVQLLSFTETTTGVASLVGQDTLTFIQTVVGHVIHSNDILLNQTISQTLTFQQTAWINGPNGDFPVSGQLEYPLGDIDLSGLDESNYVSDHLIFNETVTLGRIFHRSVTDTLVFHETLSRQMIYHRTISDQLKFLDGFNKALDLIIGGQQVIVPIPTVFVSIIGRSTRYVILRSRKGVIVLPTPEWGDTEASGNQVTVKRSMTGKVYTYVKTASWHKVHYDFTITRKKAKELQLFLRDNLSEILTLENWKGQVYIGQITQNPTSLVAAGRYAQSYEKVTVAFEFEGVRLHG